MSISRFYANPADIRDEEMNSPMNNKQGKYPQKNLLKQ
jgi:hypothetical protein